MLLEPVGQEPHIEAVEAPMALALDVRGRARGRRAEDLASPASGNGSGDRILPAAPRHRVLSGHGRAHVLDAARELVVGDLMPVLGMRRIKGPETGDGAAWEADPGVLAVPGGTGAIGVDPRASETNRGDHGRAWRDLEPSGDREEVGYDERREYEVRSPHPSPYQEPVPCITPPLNCGRSTQKRAPARFAVALEGVKL